MLTRVIPKCRNCIHLLEKTQFCNRYNVPAVEARLDYKLCSVKAIGKNINQSNEEFIKMYLDRSKRAGHEAIGYFSLSGFSFYYFIFHSPPEFLSLIFPIISGGFFTVGQLYIDEIRENYDKAKSLQKQIENKSFLTNNTKTTP
jgi:hypothetical protein